MSLHDKLHVTVIDLDIVDGQPQTNLENAASRIGALSEHPDLIVLPELFSTGFISDVDRARGLAESVDGPTMHALRWMARDTTSAIAGSMLCCENDTLYNRGFIIEPSGETACYDKHHLFCVSRESEVCAPGSQRAPVVRFRGWNLALAICYDVRFPVWLRNTNLHYDALIVPANWPTVRAFAWEHLLQARAIENQCYVIGANRSGNDAYGSYDESSYILDYQGRSISEVRDGCLTASLDRQRMRQWREKMPVWRDADPFTLG